MFTPPNTTERIVASETIHPEALDYDATVEFIGWESEMGNNQQGWDVVVRDNYNHAIVGMRYNASDGTVTTKVIKVTS